MPNSAGLVKSDPMNTTKGRVPHSYSSFDESLSYKKNMLIRYADYTPSFEMEGVPSDEIRLNTKDFIDSLSLNSPFKGTIRKIKESFKVPNMAILPFNWDLIYTQPVNGGDVPQDANCVLLDFPSEFSSFFTYLMGTCATNAPGTGASATDVSNWLTALMRTLYLGESVYSKGSLLNFCGYKANAQFRHLYFIDKGEIGTYDHFYDYVVTEIFKNVYYFTVSAGGKTYFFKGLSSGTPPSVVNIDFYGSFRAALDLIRENPGAYIGVQTGSYDSTDILSSIGDLVSYKIITTDNLDFILPPASASVYSEGDLTELNPNTLNLSRLLAYQLVCFHFYTNSSIDVVYTAELYRNYVNAFEQVLLSSSYNLYSIFSLNGVNKMYDYFSGHLIRLCTYWAATTNTLYTPTYANMYTSGQFASRLAVWASIFNFRHSLRFGDYFVGSRPRPLAPLSTDVAVNSGYVSVIDITQRQWSQKFANAVMRSRQKVEDYVDMLFGRKPQVDFHNPLFLSREVDTIYGDEVQNTGDMQSNDANSRTANMRGGLGQFTFTFHNDDMHPCIYMQIISFDVKRAYTRSVDRQFLHIDRYDMFNPSFQYIGDQPIYGIELGYPANIATPTLTTPAVFGYQSRDMEYKQRFDVCCGGFEDNLPGWILTDVDRSKYFDGALSPDFIRNYNTELDQFFLSLTGFSLGTYFHFICITQNNVFAKRPMAVDPQILG